MAMNQIEIIKNSIYLNQIMNTFNFIYHFLIPPNIYEPTKVFLKT